MPRLTTRVMRSTGLLLASALVLSQVVYFGSGTAQAVISSRYELDGNVTDEPTAGDDAENVRNGSSSALATTVGSDPVNDSGDIMFNPGGGSLTAKDTGDLSDWRWQNKEPLDKLDLIDVLSSQYLDPSTGDPLIYIGATRYDGSGASTLGFWFLQDNVELDPDGTFDSITSGAAASHVIGDVLIVADFGGSNLLDIYQWDGTAPVLTSSSTLSCLAATATSPSCGVSNPAAISSPWPIVQKGYPSTQIGPNAFVELGVNLEATLGTSLGCYQSIIATSRTSDSITATLSDLAFASVDTCAISITKSGPAVAAAGETVTYTFDITNESITPLSLDTITDDVIGDISTEATTAGCDSIRGGQTCSFDVDYTVPLTASAGSLTNTVTATYEPPNRQTSVTETDTHTVEVYVPALTVDKTAPAIVNAGAEVTYSFTITNTTTEGALAAPAITITSVVDDVLGTIDASSCGALATGASCVLIFPTTAAAIPDPLVNTVTVIAAHAGTGTSTSATDTHSLAINEPPVANDDSTTTNEDTPVSITVLANDTDPETNIDVATVEILTNGMIGTAVVNPDGTITYTPDPDASGSDTVLYRVCDELGLCDTAEVSITVLPINDPPVATDDTYSTDQDTPAGGNVVTDDTGNGVDNDVDGTLAPNATIFSGVSSGSLTFGSDGLFTFTPAPGFFGTVSFTYTVTDDLGAVSDPATVTINVNARPIATDNDYAVAEGSSVSGNVVSDDTGDGVDSDPDSALAPAAAVVANVASGTLTLNADGSFTYTPAPAFSGVDTFTYQIQDTDGAVSNVATVTVTVTDEGSPDAVDDAVSVVEDSGSTAIDAIGNDTLTDDATYLTGSLNTTGTSGTVTDNGDGTFGYTPAAGFVGTDTFTYTICDDDTPTATCDTATVTVTVTDEGSPDAVDDAVSVVEDSGSTAIDAIGNDDLTDNAAYLAGSLDTTGTSGTVVDNGDGTFGYTPAAGFVGTDTFTYTICDDDTPTATCDTATVTVTVTDEGSPDAVDDAVTVVEDSGATTIDAIGNDTLTDDATYLTGSLDTTGMVGSVTDNGDGTFDYTPAAGFVGTDTFTYTICDDDTPTATCDTATVTVTVTDEGSPDAIDDAVTVAEDSGATAIDAIGNDTLTDDATYLTGSLDTTGMVGSATDNGDGTFDYTPAAGFVGTDTFTYTICDDDTPTATCDTATVTVTVTDEGSPDAIDDAVTVAEDSGATAINAIGNDTLTDDATYLAGSLDTTGTTGSVTDNGDGTFGYTPAAGFVGTDAFTYTICDDDTPTATCDTATVTVTVTDEGSPDAIDDTATVFEDSGSTTINAIGNDTLTDDATYLTGSLNTTGTIGSVTDNGDGTFDYTPAAGFLGADTFTYTICDDDTPTATCDTATVTVTVADEGSPDAVDDACRRC